MNGKSTVLVDLDLNAGDVTTFLNMKPSYTISDVTMNISRLDRNFLQGVISKHESGISVLAEPQKIEEGVSITSSEIKKVLSLLKSMYKYIIIDAETISERTTTAIEMADMILLVFFMSLPSIKNMQRHQRYFESIGLTGQGKTHCQHIPQEGRSHDSGHRESPQLSNFFHTSQ